MPDTEGRGARRKAVSILLKVWVNVPDKLVALRDEALTHFQRLAVKDHLPLHWCMTMASYPFFAVVAETTGRLARLQDTVVAAQVQRRLREQLGERETVSRSARRVLRSFLDWGVLEESGDKGVYRPKAKRVVSDPRLIAWLIEVALLSAAAESQPVEALVHAPALFPFAIEGININRLESNPRLEVFRQMNEAVVAMRRTKHSA